MNTMTRCAECERTFDRSDAMDAEELYYGHDCEEPVGEVFWDYVHEIRELLAMPVDADAHNGERDEPETPDERMATIEHILVCQEGFEWPIDYISHIDVSHRESGHWVHPDNTLVIQPAH